MLVITRKVNQSFLIGEDIEISINRVDGDSVKVGIRAPRHIPIFRKELVEDVADQTRKAAVSPAASQPGNISAIRAALNIRQADAPGDGSAHPRNG